MAARDISHLRCDLLEYSCGYQQSNGKMRLEGRSKKNFPDSPMKIEIVQSTLDNCLVSGSGRIILLRLEANGSEQTLETIPVESLCHKTTEMINSFKSRGQKLAPFEYPMSASQGHSFVSLRFWKEGDKNKRRVIEMILSNPDVLNIVQYLRRIECPIMEKPNSRASSSQGAGLANIHSDQRPPSQASFHSAMLHPPNTNLNSSDHTHGRDGRQSAPADYQPHAASSSQGFPMARPGFGSSVSSMNALEQQPYTALGSRVSSIADSTPASHITSTVNASHAISERPLSVSSAIRPNDIEQMFPERVPSSGRNGSRGTISRDGLVTEDRITSRTFQAQPMPVAERPMAQTSYPTGETARSSSVHGIERVLSSHWNPQVSRSTEMHAYPTPARSDQHYNLSPTSSARENIIQEPPQQGLAHSELNTRVPYNDSTPHPVHSPTTTTTTTPAFPSTYQEPPRPQSISTIPSTGPATFPPAPNNSNSNSSGDREITNLKNFFQLDQSEREQIYLACQSLYDSDAKSRQEATRTLALIQLSSPDFLQLVENMNSVLEKKV